MARTEGAAALLSAAALLIPGAVRAQDADAALRLLLGGPNSAFEGRVLSTRWADGKAAASEYAVRFAPPDRWRREYLGADGKPRAVVVSDGEKETIKLISSGKRLVGDAPRSLEKVMGARREEELLRRNYALTSPGRETVAGRIGAVLELSPVEAGKPMQRLIIDEATGAVLSNRRYLAGSKRASSATYVAFVAKEQNHESFEAPAGAAAVEHALDPDFLDLAGLSRKLGRAAEFPAVVAGGFEFESGDVLTVGASKVAHARYTDGLAVVSIFETDRPVRARDLSRLGDGGPAAGVYLSGPTTAVRVKRGRRHLTLIGDVGRPLLERIGAELRGSARN